MVLSDYSFTATVKAAVLAVAASLPAVAVTVRSQVKPLGLLTLLAPGTVSASGAKRVTCRADGPPVSATAVTLHAILEGMAVSIFAPIFLVPSSDVVEYVVEAFSTAIGTELTIAVTLDEIP